MNKADDDGIPMLYEYWMISVVMYANYKEIHFDEPYEFTNVRIFMAHQLIWCSSLYVLSEGFKSLDLKASKVSSLIDVHLDSLRVYRNATFHFQKDKRKFMQFHDHKEKLGWAEELQEAFNEFFEAFFANVRAKSIYGDARYGNVALTHD